MRKWADLVADFRCCFVLVLLLLFALPAEGHLGTDRRDKATHIHGLVRAYEAEEVVANQEQVEEDETASGGRAVLARAGTELTIKTPALGRGVYAFYVSGRMRAGQLSREEDGPPVVFAMRMDPGPHGAPITYTGMHAMYHEHWQYVQELYFHVNSSKAVCSATISLTDATKGRLLIDRIELRDALSGVRWGAWKKSRYLYTDEEVKRIRARGNPVKREKLARKERAARDRELAERVPEINSVSRPDFMKERRRLYETFQRMLGGVHKKSDAELYLLNGDERLARDTAFLLAVAAYRWPALNFRLTQVQSGRHHRVNRLGQFKRQWGKVHIYRGWTGPMVRGMIRSYDFLFPFIEGNQELATALHTYIPYVEKPEDVVALLDSSLVQLAWRDYQRHQGAAPVELCAAVLGPCELSRSLLDRYSTFRDDVVSNRSRDGLTYIGSTYYAAANANAAFETGDLLKRYVDAGGHPRYDVADPARFPRLRTVFDALLGLSVAGGFRNNTGDLGNPDGKGHPIVLHTVRPPADFFLKGFRWTGDPRFAWLLQNPFQVPENASRQEQWAIREAAQRARNPLLFQRSRVQGGFGIAVMESGQEVGDPRFKRTVVIRTGVASGHAQSDTLNLALFAYGCRMAPDLGGRSRSSYGRPSTHLSRLHNLVEVDERPMGGMAINATSYGWVDAFSPVEGAQFTAASARAESHPEVDIYRRGTALIDISAGKPGEGKDVVPPRCYVFDVMRVRGGRTHTWCFHGAVSEAFSTNMELKEATRPETLEYLKGHRPGTLLEGTSADPCVATWKLRRTEGSFKVAGKDIPLQNAEKDFLGPHYDPQAPPKFTQVTLLGHGNEKVMSGHAWCYQARKYTWPMLYVQQASEQPMSAVYPSIIEPFEGESAITSKRLLDVEPKAQGAEQAIAMEVKTRKLDEEPSHTDIIFSSVQSGTVHEIEDGMTAAARFAYVSSDAQGLRMMHLVGGTRLDHPLVSVRVPTDAHSGKIVSADYEKLSLTLDTKLPVSLLRGERMRLGNAAHWSDYRIESARSEGGRSVLTWWKSAATYAGVVREVHEEKGYVVPEAHPPLFDYHPRYYDGMTAVSESAESWKVDVERGDRWMFLGYPVARQHKVRMTWEDVPDADGDGRRTLRLFCSGMANRKRRLPDGTVVELEPGEHMLDIEVTRIREDGLQFWFKQHPMEFLDSLGVPHRGWPYHNQIMRNESGTRTWVTILPEDDVRIHLAGAPLTEQSFPDADGDGKRRVTFHHFGPGDTVRLPTRVFVQRLSDGALEVRANTRCTVTFIAGRERRTVEVTEARLNAAKGRMVVR